MATTKAGARMCVVTIGLDEYLMPAAAGIKVAELMQGARQVRSDYTGQGFRYHAMPEHDELRGVSWRSVTPRQIVEAKPPRGRRAVEGDDETGAP